MGHDKHYAVIYIDRKTRNLTNAHTTQKGSISAIEWAKKYIADRADPDQPVHIVEVGTFGSHSLLNWRGGMEDTHAYEVEESK